MARADPLEDLTRARRQLAGQLHLIQLVKVIRALHIAAMCTPLGIDKTASEFFYSVGDILEGVPPEKLELKIINKEEFLRELEDT